MLFNTTNLFLGLIQALEEGKICQGLPDTNIVFNENGVDHNPTKKKTNKFLKIGKMSIKALKSVRKAIPQFRKDLVNESKKITKKRFK